MSFPLTRSANGRYLQDSSGNPFPILGRTAWFITSLSSSDQQTFLSDTVSRGFNAIEFHVINHDPRGNHPPFDGAGAAPFLKRLDGGTWSGSLNYGSGSEAPDLTTPNPAYWSAIDALVASAQRQNILLLMFPAYVGFNGGDNGYMVELVANGPSRVQSYGAFLADRYKNSPNIVWMMGGDMGSYNGSQAPVEQALRTGIDSVSNKLSTFFSAEWDSEMIGTDQQTFGPITLNGAYSWTGKEASLGRRAYSYTPVEPAFLLEEPYDQEGPDGNSVNPNATQPVRRFQYWGLLSTIGGYVAGNGYIWAFKSGWQTHLDTQGARDMAQLNGFMRSIPWQNLVPSGLAGMKTLVTSGGGSSPDSSDYVCAAATPDGKLLLAYAPPARQSSFAIDMSAMSGATRARWFNPTNGAFTDISGGQYSLPASGNTSFTVPGDNGTGYSDWLLVLDSVSAAVNGPPTVASASAASPSTITGTTTNVSVKGADDGGESNLTYTWSATGPGTVTFSPNANHSAANATATFNQAGSYTLRATINDRDGGSVTSDVKVTVNQTLTSLSVNPGSATVAPNATQTFSASSLDQFGNSLTQQPSTTWTVSGGGTISSSGVFSAGGSAGGPYSVTASTSGKTATASVTVAGTGAALYRINAGGGASAPFAADQFASGGSTYSTGNSVTTNGVANAAPAAVYQTERYGDLSYTFSGLTPGAGLLVRLHFAEIYLTSAGARIFNVTINGAAALSNFDIYATAGANVAVVRDLSASADSSGTVVIAFKGVKNNAKVSAIELFSVSGDTAALVRLNSGAAGVGAYTQDSSYSGGSAYSNSNAITTAGVTNAAPAAVYQSERYGDFSYNFSGLSPNAPQKVRLHFAEIYLSSAGARLFDVKINGAAALSSFDIFSAAGGANRACVRDFTVNADSSGSLAVQFVSVRDNAKVSGIEILAP